MKIKRDFMQLEVVSEKDNALLSRKEVVASLTEFGVTPSRKAVLEELAKKYDSPHVVIDKIEHPFGSKNAKAFAKIYVSGVALREYEREYKLNRGVEKSAQTKEA